MEVLVAVALSAIIMMALFGMFNSVAEVASDVKRQEEDSYGIRTFESILFDDLGSVYAGDAPSFSFAGKNGDFLGQDGRIMEFCTTASLGDSGTGPSFSLQRVEYSLDRDGKDTAILRRERKHCGVSGNWQWVEVPVFKGFSSVEVEYFDPLNKSFVQEWGGRKRYPGAIRMTIVDSDGQRFRFVIPLSSMAREKR